MSRSARLIITAMALLCVAACFPRLGQPWFRQRCHIGRRSLSQIPCHGAVSTRSLHELAGTYYRRARECDTLSHPAPESAKRSYRQASRLYEQILSRLDNSAEQPLATIDKTPIRMRLANCKVRLAEYADAIVVLEDVLRDKRGLVPAQVFAAVAYQEWGVAEESQQLITNAFIGSTPDIWGWRKIRQVTKQVVDRKPSFKSYFFQADYNMAKCRFLLARIENDRQRKMRILIAARSGIASTEQSFPNLGGTDSQMRYKELLSAIQNELDEMKDKMETPDR